MYVLMGVVLPITMLHGMKRLTDNSENNGNAKRARLNITSEINHAESSDESDSGDEKEHNDDMAFSAVNKKLHRAIAMYSFRPWSAIPGISESLHEGASLASFDEIGNNSLDLAFLCNASDIIFAHILECAQQTMGYEEATEWINRDDRNNGITPVLLAAARGRLSLVEIFLNAGANHNDLDCDTGDTLLHKIVWHPDSLHLLRKLVNEYNMNVVYRNHMGNKPADIARGQDNFVYQFLIGKQYARRMIFARWCSINKQLRLALLKRGVALPLIDIITYYVWPRDGRY